MKAGNRFTDEDLWLPLIDKTSIYFKEYMLLAKKRMSNPSSESYTERHHILPKSLARQLNITDVNDSCNIVTLSYKEHIYMHFYLYKFLIGNAKAKMAFALNLMLNTKSLKSITEDGLEEVAEVVTEVKSKVVRKFSEMMKGNSICLGKPMTDEAKAKLSKSRKNYYKTHCSLLKGISMTDEAKAKLSKSRKGKCMGKDNPNYQGKSVRKETIERYKVEYKGKHFSPLTEFKKGEGTGGNNPFAREVYCYELNKKFDCIREANIAIGKSENSSDISAVCRGKQKTCGVHSVTKERLHWVYWDEFPRQPIICEN